MIFCKSVACLISTRRLQALCSVTPRLRSLRAPASCWHTDLATVYILLCQLVGDGERRGRGGSGVNNKSLRANLPPTILSMHLCINQRLYWTDYRFSHVYSTAMLLPKDDPWASGSYTVLEMPLISLHQSFSHASSIGRSAIQLDRD